MRRVREILDGVRALSALRALSAEELLAADVAPREMVLDPILPAQGLTMLHSARGAGKTYLALETADAVSCGRRCLRWNAPKARRVLYVDGELPATVLRSRLASIIAGAEDATRSAEMLRIISPDFQDRPMPDLSGPAGQQMIEAHLDGVQLLILDNLSCLCRSGRENEADDWTPVQEWLLKLRQRGLAVLFPHHSGKAGAQRGTSRREDVLDCVFTLRHPTDYKPAEGLRVEVHFEKLRAYLGESARPFEVVMRTDHRGAAIWTTRAVEDVVGARAAELFAEGLTVRDVAEELQISKSKAGRLKKKLESRQRVEVGK